MPKKTLKNNPKTTKKLLEYARLDFIIKMPENLFAEWINLVNGYSTTKELYKHIK